MVKKTKKSDELEQFTTEKTVSAAHGSGVLVCVCAKCKQVEAVKPQQIIQQ